MEKKLILTDHLLDVEVFDELAEIKLVQKKTLSQWNHNEAVVAIAGSRAMAIQAAEMDLPSLKLFQLTSAGFDGVPCDRFRNKGVAVANAGTVYSAPIAETVVFGMLLMAKKLHSNPNNRRFKLQRQYHTITELSGKRVLILGVGNIGTSIADRLRGFDVTMDGYDPYCPEKEQIATMLRTRDKLVAAIGEYDYIISTMPDNSETKGFFNQELFDSMKPSAVIVNVGRRAVFQEKEFYRALKEKRIGGAVLDMFELLPNPFTNPFRRLKNVVVLPGVSAISQEVNGRLKAHMTKNLLSALKGSEIFNVINGVK